MNGPTGPFNRVVAVVQARTASTRLPRKVLADVSGRSLIERVVRRVALADVDAIIVAIPDSQRDDELADLVTGKLVGNRCAIVRGPEKDVLSRYVEAVNASPFMCEAVLRVTADCPFLDPGVINAMIRAWKPAGERHAHAAMVTNNEPPSFPHGYDAEVISTWALRMADCGVRTEHEREHVSPWIRSQAKSGRFEVINLVSPQPMEHIRLTVDYPEDLDLARAIYMAFRDRPFTSADLVWLFERRPDLVELMGKAVNRALADGRAQHASRGH